MVTDNSTTKWSNVMVYWWGSRSTNPGWGSGQTMSAVTEYSDLYVCEVPDDCDGMLFYNGTSGTGNQSENVKNADIHNNGVWTLSSTTSLSLTYQTFADYQSTHQSGSGDSGSGGQSDDNYPDMYLTGANYGSWTPANGLKFDRSGNNYSLTVSVLNGQFKITNSDWTLNYGSNGESDGSVAVSQTAELVAQLNGKNWTASNVSDVTITFSLTRSGNGYTSPINVRFAVGTGGGDTPSDPPTVSGLSGTLPVLYINIYDANGDYDNAIIDRNLADKNYRKGEYWLDLNGCQWLAELGAQSIGSADDRLPLEMKARGNYTRTGFAKKPYKLKLGAKQNMLNIGNAKSKHWTLLTHADDTYGYLRNFIGFNLGKRMGLPWVPWQQPVEVVINGDYRGLYFLTEGIRVGDGRVMIEELADNCEDRELISGGYLVELDNYDEPEESQIQMVEKTCVFGHNTYDPLRVTFNTPEVLSPIQRKFLTEQFSTMNDLVGANSNDLWKYMDLDDAARYYVVEEIMSHCESYHGSTYLFRDRGEGQKWHFSPLWDFGQAFVGSTNQFFYDCDTFGNTWIPSMRQNAKFNAKVRESWLWFMSNCYDGLMNDINQYVEHIRQAAISDRARWKDEPMPNSVGGNNPSPVVDNSNMTSRRDAAVNHLNAKINWLKQQFGDYTHGTFTEPERDDTEPAPLPSYLDPNYQPKRLYVYNDADWNGINAYIYNSLGDYMGWPGVSVTTYNPELTYTDGEGNQYTGLYVYELPDDYLTGNIIFSEAQGERRYPANLQPGLSIGGGDIIFFTSWTKIVNNPDVRVIVTSSGTLPLVKINTTDKAAIGYGDEGKVTGTMSIDPLSTGEKALSEIAVEIKGRGNSWDLYDKKAYKLKLGSKSQVLDMPKSKHWVLLPYVEDKDNGLLSNYAGHVLAKSLGLDWTPDIKPVEVMLNGDYIGVYFIGENVRAESTRVPVIDKGDNGHVAGEDWILEVDKFAVSDQARYTWTDDHGTYQIVPSVPEFADMTMEEQTQYTALLKEKMDELVQAVATAKENPFDTEWMNLIDADQAARFYIVNEIMDCADAYTTSCYLYRTTDSKWKFGPVWNFNRSFASGDAKSDFIHGAPNFDGAFIADLYSNVYFRYNVIKIFTEEVTAANEAMRSRLPGVASPSGVSDEIANMDNALSAALTSDAEVWPAYAAASNAGTRLAAAIENNIKWLSTDTAEGGGGWMESTITGVEQVNPDSELPGVYYDLTGRRVDHPAPGSFLILRQGAKAQKVLYR